MRGWDRRDHVRGLLVSWGQRFQESSRQEKETKNNPERESPERGTGKWGAEGQSEQGNSDASLTAQIHTHTLRILPHRQHITHTNPRTPLPPHTVYCELHSPTAYPPSKLMANPLFKHIIQHPFPRAVETAHTHLNHSHKPSQHSYRHTAPFSKQMHTGYTGTLNSPS